MVHATLRMIMPVEKRGEALQILTSVAERCRFEVGCISCRIYQDALEGSVLMVEEMWQDEESLYRHLRSDDFRDMLLLSDIAVETPEIRFSVLAASSGVETIIKARNTAL